MPSVFIPEENDDAYRRHEQRLLDAFAEGRRIGQQGLGAGLCPQDMTEAEQREWRRGHNQGAGEYVTNRRAA